MKCLITDHIHPFFLIYLQKKNIEFDYLPDILQQEVEDSLQNYQILIVNSKIKINADFASKASHLLAVGRLGSGLDGIDVQALESHGVACLRTPDANANAVAEHAIGMLLSLVNKMHNADQEIRSGIWHREKNRGMEIADKVLGVIGVGHTGSLFAYKMSAMVQKVICYDKYLSGYGKNAPYSEESSMEDVMKEADIISFHLPLTEETRHIVDMKFLKKCKPGVVLINTSRGGIINTEDLLECLHSGSVMGACLDVFENEKTETYSMQEEAMYNKLYELHQVILTPHIAGWTFESYYKIAESLANKIDKILEKKQ